MMMMLKLLSVSNSLVKNEVLQFAPKNQDYSEKPLLQHVSISE